MDIMDTIVKETQEKLGFFPSEKQEVVILPRVSSIPNDNFEKEDEKDD